MVDLRRRGASDDDPSRARFPEVTKALTKTDLAYLQIRRAILEGLFTPGSMLDQEELAEQLDLSTTPVREALRRLESEHLVVRRAHRDTVVAPLSMTTVEEAFAIRLALDPLAASLAATEASADERRYLEALLAGDEPVHDPAARVTGHRELHRGIYNACHNSILVEMLESLWDVGDRYRLVAIHVGAGTSPIYRDHGPILEAVLEGRAKDAAKLMHEHTTEAFQSIRDTAG